MADIEQRLAAIEARLDKLEGKTAGKSGMTASWQPREQDIEWAEQEVPGVDWRLEADKFRDYWLASGQRKANWYSAFRNWCRKATVYQARDSASKGRSPSRTAIQSASNDSKRQRVLDKLASVRQVTSAR